MAKRANWCWTSPLGCTVSMTRVLFISTTNLHKNEFESSFLKCKQTSLPHSTIRVKAFCRTSQLTLALQLFMAIQDGEMSTDLLKIGKKLPHKQSTFVYIFNSIVYDLPLRQEERKEWVNTCRLAWAYPISTARGWGCSACSWTGAVLASGLLYGSRWATRRRCELLPWAKKNLWWATSRRRER